jgi:hypothetical protein
MASETRLGSSFRDPSGFVYFQDGVLLRQVNGSYGPALRQLSESNLLRDLVDANLLIRHDELDLSYARSGDAIAVLKPERVGLISYPYEWSFSQLKSAALVTLKIQKLAIQKGMTLKDASAFNIQFHRGTPTLIDTLSFELYEEGKPWKPYRQYCQHFVAPLVLMSHVDIRLTRLSASYIDGIPLDLASRISKPFTRLNPRIAMHLHLHAQMQSREANSAPQKRESRSVFGKNALLGLIDSLEGLVEKLSWKPEGTEWADYYNDTNYSPSSMFEKHRLVNEYLDTVRPSPSSVWDLGANNGEFSRISSGKGIQTVAWDIDPAAVEKNFLAHQNDALMLPLVQDLTNPSPAIGWSNRERESFIERGPAGAIMALALIHHLAIGNNVPLSDISAFLARIGMWLIIEFVPKEDSQVQRLLSSREDVFPNYVESEFEVAFQSDFEIIRKTAIPDTKRTLYLMKKREM